MDPLRIPQQHRNYVVSLPPGLVLEKWRSGTMLSVNTPAVTPRAFAEGLARIALAKNTGPDPPSSRSIAESQAAEASPPPREAVV